MLDFLFGSPENRFAKRAVKRLLERGFPPPITYVKKDFALKTSVGIHYLGALFHDWRTYPADERDRVFDQCLDAFFDPPTIESAEEILPLLRPVVRSRRELHVLESELSKTLPTHPLAADLAITVVVDRPHSFTYLTDDTLERLALSFESVLTRAIENLRSAPAPQLCLQEQGFYTVDEGDAYATSRLLQPEIFETLGLEGHPVALAPARGCLLVAGADDVPALEAMAEIGVAFLATASRPISHLPLTLRRGVWTSFEPGPNLPTAVRLLPVRQALWEYDVQTEALKTDESDRDDGPYIAKMEVIENEGRILTYATWTDGLQTLLPKTDALILHDAYGNSIWRRWEDVETVCGAFAQATDFHPPRFRTAQTPDADDWRRLRKDFSPPAGWKDLD